MMLSRRVFLIGATASAAGATTVFAAPSSELLRYPPPELRDAVTLDLNKLSLEAALPAWSQADKGFDYRRAMSSATAIPSDRDVLVKGATTGWRTGRNYLIGGRRVHVMGGAYRRAFQFRQVAESITYEGMVINIPEDTPLSDQQDLFDGTFLTESWPEVETTVFVLNCRGLNGRGAQKETHGDLMQLSGSTSSVPRRVRVDKFTGTTSFQGFMLSPQVFGKNARVDGPIPIGIWLSRVNLRALNPMTLEQSNPPIVSNKTVAA